MGRLRAAIATGVDTPSAVAGQFQVNTYTNSTQSYPSVASFSDGGYIVTWHSSGHDGSGHGIYGQRFAADGTPHSDGEFLVNTDTTSSEQYYPSVTALSDDAFVVTWYDGGRADVYGQMFNADGTEQGSEFRINSYTNSTQSYPSVTGLAGTDAGFVVTWQDDSQHSGGSNTDVRGQVYDNSGTPVGDEFEVNTSTYHHQQDPSVTALDDGSFVVTWESRYQDYSSSWGIYGQHFNADGSKATEAKLIGASADETLVFDTAQEGVALDLGDGIDTLTMGSGNDTVAVSNVEHVDLGGGDDLAVVRGESFAHQTDELTLSGTVEAAGPTIRPPSTARRSLTRCRVVIQSRMSGRPDPMRLTAMPVLLVAVTAMTGDGTDDIIIRANETGAGAFQTPIVIFQVTRKIPQARCLPTGELCDHLG